MPLRLNIKQFEYKGSPVELDINVGVIEKEIELFIPLIIPGLGEAKNVEIDEIIIEYTTLQNERLRYIQDLEDNIEVFYTIAENGDENIIYKHKLTRSTWIYPNKINLKW